ncbi:MAG TPA: hypothetical protein VGQ36_04175 [Thermoanaerobaculia bacterium]|jgi:hypothetical protein|nr:hypothetical protein [Thermoanaerobaculia bacterium]
MKSSLVIFSLVAFLGCRTIEPTPVVTFDKLSPETQERIKPLLGSGDPNDQWWTIVQAACKTNPTANCVCCQQGTTANCNMGNWDCCASAVFSPADASACTFPSPCNCPSPP